MNQLTIWGILHNAALLMIMVFFYGTIGLKLQDYGISLRHILAGISIGIISLMAMMTPMPFLPGIDFTFLSIVLSLSGLFFGATPTLIAVVMAIVYRGWLGGSGLFAGILTIFAPAAIGFAWRRYQKCELARIPFRQLLLFGFFVHGIDLLIESAFPNQSTLTAGLLILSTYPMLTALVGLIFRNRQSRVSAEQALIDSENRYRQLFEAESDAILLVENATGKIIEANKAAETLYQYSHDELVAMKNVDVSAEPEKTRQANIQHENPIGELLQIPLRIHRRKDGTEIPVEITGCYFEFNGKSVHIATIRDISARLKAEAALREEVEALKKAEETLRHQAHILENISEVIITADFNFTIQSWNPAAERLYGWTAAEVIGKQANQIIKKIYSDDILKRSLDILFREGHWSGETVHYHKNGTPVHILESASLLRDLDGNPTTIVSFQRDITERVRAETQISGAMNYIHTLLEASPVGIVTYKAVGPAVSVNPKAAEIFGVSTEILLKENFREIPYWKAIGLLDLALKALESGQEQENEFATPLSSGKVIWLNFRISPFWHNNEQHIVCMFTDISSRKQTEEALEKRIIALTRPIENKAIPFEDLFNLDDIQSIQDSFSEISGVAAVITQPDNGNPITRQSHFCRLCRDIVRKSEKGRLDCLQTENSIVNGAATGPNVQLCLNGGLWSASTSISVGGQHIADWIIGQVRNPDQTDEAMCQYARSIDVDEGEFLSALHELPVMNLEQFENTAKAMCVFAGQLSALAYQNVQQARFIADRDRAENQIRQMNQELEHRVRERTAALEIANRELEAFAHSIAHDLRTPLRSILSFSQILQHDYSEQLDEDGKHYLNRISVAVPFMAQLIDDLLRLSHVTRRNLTVEKINLSSLAEEILEAFAYSEPKRIVTWNIQPDLIVTADASLIAIAFENLLSNAWKFTSQHPTARIEVGAQTVGTEIEYYIRDDGAGFDMIYADKLFTPFQRLHGKDIFEGTGIGLAIVQRIIQKHGGRIWANGAIDQGATFWFTLPTGEGTKIDGK
jgi:PAS domain S-box-containing protein